MRPFRDWTLRAKLTVIVTSVSVLALFVAAGCLMGLDSMLFRSGLVQDLGTLARVTASNTSPAISFNDPQAASKVLASLEAHHHINLAAIYLPDGRLFASFSRNGQAVPATDPRPASGTEVFHHGMAHVFQEIRDEHAVIGWLYVQSNLDLLTQQMSSFLLILTLALGLALVVAFVVTLAAQRAVTRPVLDLAGAARAVSARGDLSVRVVKTGEDEIGVLTDAFNRMLDTIAEQSAALARANGELEVRVAELQTEAAERHRAEEALSRSEAALRHSQKMEAVGQLAGGVAHDFNNLLTAMLGYSNLLRGKLGSDRRLIGYVDEVVRAGERAASLTRQLLAFSRKQVLEPEVLDVKRIVAQLEKMLRRLIGENIELTTVFASEMTEVRADPTQVDQVIMNLCVNARDAMPDGGRLTIEVGLARLDESFPAHPADVVPGEYVRLSVRDTGCGMDPETQSRIFEPFFTTKGVGKGTGLGLSTVYGIVKQSGGQITVQSQKGGGTVFDVYLPRVEPMASAPPAVKPKAVSAGSETVLLVEDEPQVRDLARDILHLFGYHVVSAADGSEAVGVADRHPGRIDLLLTDVIMPRMNGRELYERLKSARPEMKVAFMSGYTDGIVAGDGILESAAAFIHKPFSPEDLGRKVRQVLDRAAA